ncbi:MAG: ChbG/HpnK family deacetylase [Acidobacteriota bacterium]|nr:ChbG/HpnK family deacetylase [Acidobacteriota bacterium]
MMNDKRYLVVNADDFGQSEGINRGVITAHEQGIVTSASLMVRWQGAAEAARYGLGHPRLSLGMHFDICEWSFKNGEWVNLYQVVPDTDALAIAAEFGRQLAAFRDLTGQDPTHLDSHQHVHRQEPARTVLIGAARELRVPLRSMTPAVRYCGEFYGQASNGYPYPEGISVEGIKRTLGALACGVTELGCHPGLGGETESMYNREREVELMTLCDPRVKEAIESEGIELCSFRDVANLDMPGLVP